MLTPTELKSKQFSKVMFGGYSMEEVDRLLDTVTPDYEMLYSENAELTKKVEMLLEKLETSNEQEESIKAAIINAQKMCDSIIREAQHSGELIIKSAKNQAEKTKERAEESVRDKQVQFVTIKNEVDNFKSDLVAAYRNHLQKINSIPSVETFFGESQIDEGDRNVKIEQHSGTKEQEQPSMEVPYYEDEVEVTHPIVEQFKVELPSDVQQEIDEDTHRISAVKIEMAAEFEDKTPTGEFSLGGVNKGEPDQTREYVRKYEKSQNEVDIISTKEERSLIDEDYDPELDTNSDVLNKHFSSSLQFGEKFERIHEKPKIKGKLFR